MKRRRLLIAMQILSAVLFLFFVFFCAKSYSRPDFLSWGVDRGYYFRSDHGVISLVRMALIGSDETHQYYLPPVYIDPNAEPDDWRGQKSLSNWPVWTNIPVSPLEFNLRPNWYGFYSFSYVHPPHEQFGFAIAYWIPLLACMAFAAPLGWRLLRELRRFRGRGFDVDLHQTAKPPP